MVRHDQRDPVAVKERVFDPKLMVQIDVVQIQERKNRTLA